MDLPANNREVVGRFERSLRRGDRARTLRYTNSRSAPTPILPFSINVGPTFVDAPSLTQRESPVRLMAGRYHTSSHAKDSQRVSVGC
jgi:hypothetical protein